MGKDGQEREETRKEKRRGEEKNIGELQYVEKKSNKQNNFIFNI